MEFRTGNISFECRWYQNLVKIRVKISINFKIYICYYLVRFCRLKLRADKTSNKIPHVNSKTQL